MKPPTIVIAAYNRPLALQRLLEQVGAAQYTTPVDLVISIDKGGDKSVKIIAEAFNWPFGNKTVKVQPKHMGLWKHIMTCGDLTELYGSIILLEDDLGVSPWFYHYALQAMAFFQNDAQVAGISLYGYGVAESSFQPFFVPEDGSDNYFMQFPSSWGQMWSLRQWKEFRQWQVANDHIAIELPNFVKKWSGGSWKRDFLRYLIATNKYFAFPRTSLSTNYGDKGENFSIDLYLFRVAVENEQRDYRFTSLTNSTVIFDSWFEIQPESLKQRLPYLAAYDFAVDIYARKDLTKLKQPYVLTAKPARKSVFAFANDNAAGLLNIIHNNTGEGLYLAETDKVENWVDVARIEDMEYVKARMDGRVKPGFLRFMWFKTKYSAINYANVARKLLFARGS